MMDKRQLIGCLIIVTAAMATRASAPKPASVKVDISGGNETISVSKKDTLKIICLRPNEMNGSIRISWLKDGEEMAEDLFPRTTFTRLFMQIDKIKKKDAGIYECRLKDEFPNSSDISRFLNVSVNSLKEEKHSYEYDDDTFDNSFSYEDVSYSEENENAATICKASDGGYEPNPCFEENQIGRKMHGYLVKSAGTSVTLYCNPRGNPVPDVTWYKDDYPFNAGGFHHVLRNNSIVLKELTSNDYANYRCVASNIHGEIEYNMYLVVNHRESSPPAISEFVNQTAVEGSNVLFECFGIDVIIQFIRVQSNEIIQSRTTNATIAQDQHFLYFENVTLDDAGWYTCIAANSIGKAQTSVYLDVVKEFPMETVNSIAIGPVAGVIASVALAVLAIILIAYRLVNKFQERRARLKMQQNLPKTWIKRVSVQKVSAPDEEGALIPKIDINNVISNSPNPKEYEFPTDMRWEFPRENLILDKILGEGAFGEVRLGVAIGILEPAVKSTVAVKSLKQTHTDAELIDLISEMETMKELGRHCNIINLLGCCTVGGELLVIMEYAELGNLKDYLRTHRLNFSYKNSAIIQDPSLDEKLNQDTLTFRDLMSFAYQVARGMDYLAQRKFVHRDLAARNVLLTSERVVKIADFGMARNTFASDYYRKRTDGRVPIKWMAPETLIYRRYTTQSDVWSYGILLYEIVTLGGTPYPQMQDMNQLLEFIKNGKRMTKPQHNCPDELYMIMIDCWLEAPNSRPSFGNLVEDIGRILFIASEFEYFQMEGNNPVFEGEVETPPSSPENSLSGTIMFDPEFVKSFSES